MSDRSATASTLHAQVAERLRQEIVTGVLRAGTRLTEAQLSQRYFVSRSPVRVALRMIEEEGLVASLRGSHRLVAQLGDRETDELFELRSLLETRAAVHAAESPDLGMLREAVEILRAGERAVADGRLGDLAELNARFHAHLVEGAGTPTLRAAHEPLVLRMRWAHPGSRGEGLDLAWVEHRRILDAMIVGDPVEAERLTADHLRRCRSRHAGSLLEVRAG